MPPSLVRAHDRRTQYRVKWADQQPTDGQPSTSAGQPAARSEPAPQPEPVERWTSDYMKNDWERMCREAFSSFPSSQPSQPSSQPSQPSSQPSQLISQPSHPDSQDSSIPDIYDPYPPIATDPTDAVDPPPLTDTLDLPMVADFEPAQPEPSFSQWQSDRPDIAQRSDTISMVCSDSEEEDDRIWNMSPMKEAVKDKPIPEQFFQHTPA